MEVTSSLEVGQLVMASTKVKQVPDTGTIKIGQLVSYRVKLRVEHPANYVWSEPLKVVKVLKQAIVLSDGSRWSLRKLVCLDEDHPSFQYSHCPKIHPYDQSFDDHNTKVELWDELNKFVALLRDAVYGAPGLNFKVYKTSSIEDLRAAIHHLSDAMIVVGCDPQVHWTDW
jgi:hypothetical protein